jgi:hypothetical protein
MNIDTAIFQNLCGKHYAYQLIGVSLQLNHFSTSNKTRISQFVFLALDLVIIRNNKRHYAIYFLKNPRVTVQRTFPLKSPLCKRGNETIDQTCIELRFGALFICVSRWMHG